MALNSLHSFSLVASDWVRRQSLSPKWRPSSFTQYTNILYGELYDIRTFAAVPSVASRAAFQTHAVVVDFDQRLITLFAAARRHDHNSA